MLQAESHVWAVGRLDSASVGSAEARREEVIRGHVRTCGDLETPKQTKAMICGPE